MLRIVAILCSAGTAVALPLLPLSIAEGGALTSAHASSGPAWNPFTIINPYKPAKAVPSSAKRRTTALKPLTANVTKLPSAPLLPVVKKPDIRASQQTLADAVLRALPSGCRDHLKTFIVRYDNPDNRGLGGKTTIIIDGNVPDHEFMALLTHECGHVIHSNWQGSVSSGFSEFKDGMTPFYNDSPVVAFFKIAWSSPNVLKQGVSSKDLVSGYAKSDAFEYFAETFAAYVLHPEALQAQAEESPLVAQQLTWMRRYLPMQEPLSRSAYAWSGKAPWDITKLPYEWIGPKNVAMR